ncbi:CsbD family protein [Rhodobacteraceae bacterium D3-12]|nr:CsbD family protein [Rhodobacteraceae bacterium D3-12]
MNWDQIEGKWKQIKGGAQEKWGALTNDDLDQVEGNAEKLVGKVQERYGKSREEAEKEVNDWLATL